MFANYTTTYFIDTVQTAKKEFVRNFITNEAAAKAWTDFVDAQTTYTKSFVDSADRVFTETTKEAGKMMSTQFAKSASDLMGKFTK